MKAELLDSMGGDLAVVNAARVSMNKHTDEMRDRDRRLIHYLAEHGHVSPFFHVMLRCRISAPIFVARQWFRHQIGFARSEVSRRYVADTPDVWTPETVRERPSENIKQGSGGAHPQEDEVAEVIEQHLELGIDTYEALIARGVAPEQARAVLPQATYTQWIETASLYAYARLCRERMDEHAQQEIRELAEQVAAHCEQVAPESWRALMGNKEGE